MRRWRANGARHLVEFDSAPVELIKKAFAATAADADKRALDVAAKLGTMPPPTLKDVTPHVLRHTAASWAMQSGAEPWAVSGYLGMTLKTVQATYGHHHPDHLGAIGETLTRAGRRSGNASVMLRETKREQTRSNVTVDSKNINGLGANEIG